MEYTTLGGTGEKVSRVGLGIWQFSQSWGIVEYRDAFKIVSRAIEVGINLVDTALIYGGGTSERFLGQALKEIGVARDEVLISTKIPGELLSFDDTFRALDLSLKRLQTSYVDIIQAHWPPIWRHIPICEYARALERLVSLGRARFIGMSDHPKPVVEEFLSCLSKYDVEVLQYRFNLAEREAEKEIVPLAEELDATLTAWSPLAKGAILGKYSLEDIEKLKDVRSGEALFKPDNYRQILALSEKIKEIASRIGKTPAQVALNWLIMYSDNIVPIPGAKSEAQVEENAGAVGWRLSYSDWRLLDEESRKLKLSYVTYEE